MSQLIIADLSFCDSKFPSKCEVKGGSRHSRIDHGTVSSDVKSDVTSDVKSYVDRVNGKIVYGLGGAVAGAVAGANSSNGRTATSEVDVNTRVR